MFNEYHELGRKACVEGLRKYGSMRMPQAQQDWGRRRNITAGLALAGAGGIFPGGLISSAVYAGMTPRGQAYDWRRAGRTFLGGTAAALGGAFTGSLAGARIGARGGPAGALKGGYLGALGGAVVGAPVGTRWGFGRGPQPGRGPQQRN